MFLTQILRLKKNLTALDVSCNLLSDYGVLAILEALCSVRHIQFHIFCMARFWKRQHSR